MVKGINEGGLNQIFTNLKSIKYENIYFCGFELLMVYRLKQA